jgi:exosortase
MVDTAAVRRRGSGLLRTTEAVVLVAVAAALVAPAFVHAYEVWSTTEEFSFGFLIPPISVGLIVWRRAAIRRSVGRGANTGLLLALPSLAIYLLAHRIELHALGGLMVPPLLIGAIVYLVGWNTGREIAFPVAFLAFGLGVFRGLLDSVGFVLQEITAYGASLLAHGVGIPVIRDGLILSSDTFAFVVAEPCSGMSSLVSLLALGALWTHVAKGPLPARLVVIASILPLVVVANSTRVALVLVVASWFGQDAALGFFHSVSSLILFGMALIGLMLVSRSVGCKTLTLASSS